MPNQVVSKETVSLEFYDSKYQKQLGSYYLPEDQAKYSSLPQDALKQCEKDEGRYPIVILHKDQPAGFFVLHEGKGIKKFTDNDDAILVRSYSISHSFQGKGIAKKSFELIKSFVKDHFPDKNEVILGVNYKNKVAQYVYEKSGFTDKGLRVMGRRGILFILHLVL